MPRQSVRYGPKPIYFHNDPRKRGNKVLSLKPRKAQTGRKKVDKKTD